MSADKAKRREALLEKFRQVAAERVAHLGSGWVRLEQAPDDTKLAGELARQIHTLKGEARALGLEALNALTHLVEDLFHRARSAGFAVGPEVGDTFLAGVDALGAAILSPALEPAPAPELIDRLQRAFAPVDGPPAPSPIRAPIAPAVESPAAPREELALRVSASRIAAISERALELRVSQGQTGFLVGRTLKQLRQLSGVLDRLRGELRGRGTNAAEELAEVARSSIRSTLAQLLDLRELVHQQTLWGDSLDEASRELRLVPAATVLDPFVRAVRDMGAEVGKQIFLSLEGVELEADKRVFEALEEPILHLLRNAVDHGIEAPAERTAAGKPAAGTIVIRVTQPGTGQLGLTIQDDGAGVDPAKIRRRAVEQRLLSDDAAAALTDAESVDLMFIPGFTTRTAVGSLSGRGVGMDVVKRRTEELGGRLVVESTPGLGMRIQLTVPISISLTRVLILGVGNRLFGLPTSPVLLVHRPAAEELFESPQGLVFRWNGEPYPVVSLARLVGERGPFELEERLLLLQRGSERVALRVGHVKGEASVVVRPLERPVANNPLVLGAGLLSSGELALVLDPGRILEARSEGATRTEPARREGPRSDSGSRMRRALVVDDSVIFRALLTDMLTGLGYHVREATDGQQGLDTLPIFEPDIVLTDLQMPRVDGLELIRKLRREPAWRHLPIVAISTLSSPQDRRAAIDVGADAYLVKGELDERSVDAVLQRLLPTD